MSAIDDLITSLTIDARDGEQQRRVNELSKRSLGAFRNRGSDGIQDELESDWDRLKNEFDSALQDVKKDTGLF